MGFEHTSIRTSKNGHWRLKKEGQRKCALGKTMSAWVWSCWAITEDHDTQPKIHIISGQED